MTVIYDERTLLHGPYFNDAGRLVPSVTTVIGPNLGWDSDKLYSWIARVTRDGYDYEALTRVAAEVGTCCHQMVERFLNSDLEPLDPATWSPRVWGFAQAGLESFTQWYDEHDVRTLFTEVRLVHPTLAYGGTLDFGCEIGGHPALVDFKTSDAVRRGHIIQVSAYRELWRQRLDGDPQVHVLRLNVRGGRAHFQDVTSSMDLAFRVFAKLLELNALKEEWEMGLTSRLAALL